MNRSSQNGEYGSGAQRSRSRASPQKLTNRCLHHSHLFFSFGVGLGSEVVMFIFLRMSPTPQPVADGVRGGEEQGQGDERLRLDVTQSGQQDQGEQHQYEAPGPVRKRREVDPPDVRAGTSETKVARDVQQGEGAEKHG